MTWCPLPWMSLNTRSNGDLRLCCQANVSEGRGILKDEGGRALNAGREDIQSARNAPLMREVRQSMLKGEWHPACLRCQNEEKAGLVSRRSYEIEKWQARCNPESTRLNTSTDGSIEPAAQAILSLDIRFGNKCNLKCRMCSPMDSSSWYGDWFHLFGDSYKDSDRKIGIRPGPGSQFQSQGASYDWYEAPEFWRRLESVIDSVEFIQTVGGEPLLIDQYYDFLERIVASGRASQVTIESNSNMTVIPEKAWQLWRHFKSVRFGASIDGVGAVNDYIRHPSKWKVIERNLHRLDQAEGQFELWFTNTVQVYNIWHFPELVKWRLEQGFQRFNSHRTRPLLTPHVLHRPDFFNIRILPREVKEAVTQRLRSFSSQIDSYGEFLKADYQRMIEGFISYMNQSDQSAVLPKFWAITQGLDRLREESFAQVFPEMFHLLEPHLQTREVKNYVLRRAVENHPS